MSKGSERRLNPRINQKLPIKIVANGYDFATITNNISSVGAYCTIQKYLPPFTKIALKLSLPIATKNEQKNCKVECKGVVVRSEDDSSGAFNVAIFFNEINDSQRHKISQYINQFLPQQS